MARIRMRRAGHRRKDSGYMLLFLMVAVAVLTIMMLGVARNYRRSIVRDREVEMMHRGDQYSRAVKRYYKKNGTYPVSIEQLENMNNIRYLRKRYKDPMSPNGEWKLVHLTDIALKPGGGLASAASTGTGTQTGLGASSSSTFGSSLGNPGGSSNSANPSTTGGTTGTTGAGTTNAGTTTAGTTDAGASGATTTGTSDAGTSGDTGMNNNAATGGQVLGGGPVLGVVSKMKTQGIHSFGGKSKYNEWFFIYDPTQDKGQLLVGPYNPNMFIGSSAGAGLTPANGALPAAGPGTATGTTAPGSSLSNQPSTPPAGTPLPSAPTQ